jgi:uncharacterized protein DUF3300
VDHSKTPRQSPRQIFRGSLAVLCACLVGFGDVGLLGQEPTPAPAAPVAAKIPPDQLDSLVAPIALYPDPLLAQTLAASTYPLEIVQLQQWLAKNPSLRDKALADAVAKQPFDPSVQALAAFPDVVKRLGDDIQWANDLGNAFLAQQSDVMDAVQRMRKKAQGKGKLESNEQQRVETQVIEKKEVIIIEPAKPDVIYVPSYDPVVVYGPPAYPYYPYPYYPYYPYGGAFMAFGVGIAMGAFWGGVWGGCGWGNNTININNNNNFNRNNNVNRPEQRGGDRGQGNRGQGNRGQGNRGQGGNWSHNPSHRGGTPYGDKATASKFGGNTRGDSLSNRQSSDRARSAQSGLARSSDRAGAGAGSRSGGAGVSDRSAGAGNRGGSSGSGRGGGDFNRSGSGDRVGSRDVGGGGSRGASGLGGGSSGGFSGSGARSSSSRGSSSFSGGSRGGGSRGGGGGRGGGGRR